MTRASETAPPVPRRVVVWSTGGVGSNAIRAIAGRRDLELVGVWVHTPDKIGRDAGELAGIAPLGVAATGDLEHLVGLGPDCVVYAAVAPSAVRAPSRTTSCSCVPASTW